MKQNKNKYFTLLIAAAMLFSLQSCLKNNSFYVDFSKGSPAVELPLAAVHTNQPFAVSFDVSTAPTQYYAVVNVASVNKPTSTVTATLAIDNAYLTQYNNDQDAAAKKAQADYLAADTTHTVNDSNYPDNYDPYEILPDSSYSIPSFNVSIAAGHREDSVPIMLFTDKIAPGHSYILPITIQTASLPISNWNHLLVNVGAKNKFDGKYTVTGTFVHTNAAFTANYPKTVGLVTQGLLTDAYFDYGVNGGTFGYGFLNGGSGSYFGNWAPVFTFDADGNVTKVSNYYVDAAPRSRDAQLDTSPGTVNKYDIANKTMDVSYYFIQAGGIVAKIHEMWTYKGPR